MKPEVTRADTIHKHNEQYILGEGIAHMYIFHLGKQLRPNTVREPGMCSDTLYSVLPRATIQYSCEKKAPHSAPRNFTGTKRKRAPCKRYADYTILALCPIPDKLLVQI